MKIDREMLRREMYRVDLGARYADDAFVELMAGLCREDAIVLRAHQGVLALHQHVADLLRETPFEPQYEAIDIGLPAADFKVERVRVDGCDRLIDEFERLPTVDLDVMHDELTFELRRAALELLGRAVRVGVADEPISSDSLRDIEIEDVGPLLAIVKRLQAVKDVRMNRR